MFLYKGTSFCLTAAVFNLSLKNECLLAWTYQFHLRQEVIFEHLLYCEFSRLNFVEIQNQKHYQFSLTEERYIQPRNFEGGS